MLLPFSSVIAFNAAVIVPAPHNDPIISTGSNFKAYFPKYKESICGIIDTNTPISNISNPIDFNAGINAAPASNPTTAINKFNPTLFKNQRVDDGIWPKWGCLFWYHPNNKPENNAPPPLPSVNGTNS